MTDTLQRLRRSVTAKLVVIGAILLAMLIPLKMVEGLIRERTGERERAAAEIARSWGGAQTIGGPIVVVPFRYDVMDRQGINRRVEDELYFLPRELMVEGGADMQVLSRGIYQIPVYSASLSIAGELRAIDIDAAAFPGLELLWPEAEIVLPVSDPRSLRAPVTITIGDDALEFEPGGATLPGLGPTLRAPLGTIDRQRFDERQTFAIALTLAGTGSLQFRPDGDTTRVALRSDWPSPSFGGAYLPEARSVSGNGFDASWQVLALGRGYPATWRRAEHATAGSAVGMTGAAVASFGVDFLIPVNVHSSSLRAIKYAVLYLAVTFAAFLLFEVFARLHLHPVQYLSIGLANGIFYLLLLALAEHAGFGPAYIASAVGSTALIGGYAAAILGSTHRAVPIAGLLAGLYLYLYATLRAEDFALLIGAIGLFGLLAAFMYLTRRVDWYALELAPADDEGERTSHGSERPGPEHPAPQRKSS